MTEANALVLEVFRQDNQLALSIFEQKEIISTLRHYSQVSVSFAEINKLCQEVIFILNKADKRGILETDLSGSLKKAGQLLWDHLLTRPVKEKLKNCSIPDLILSLDEELINIPWELLYTGEDFLSLKFNLGRLIRTKAQASPPQYRSFSGNPRMLILANPTDDLKSAYLEGLNIKNQFDKKRREICIDFKSTQIDRLYIKKNLRDYDIVHFAGHCEYDKDNPEDNGWVLSDGKFTTRDIYALGETLALPSLVFSNACHSAEFRGDYLDERYQEKAYGLASAFLFSGVRHYIGTIRRIEDPASLSFAREFYTQLISGSSIGECMRLSRLKLIKEFGVMSTHWTNYLLYGNPNFVLFRAKIKPAAPKIKKSPVMHRKQAAWVALAIAIISICIYLYMSLPTLKPSTYILSLKAQKLFLAGDNQQAISLLSRIIKKDPLFLAAYTQLADTYQRLGDKEKALKYYFDYSVYSEKKRDNKNLAASYIGIGWTYHLDAEYTKALDFYHKAIALAQEVKDKLNEAIALRKLAVWHIDKEDYDKALELLTRSSEINRERQHLSEYRYNLACDYFDMGLVFSNKEDLATAREFYNKSRILFEKLKLKSELSDYYFNLGEIYLIEKQHQKALDCYLKGLKLDQRQGSISNLAGDFNMIGELYLEMDNLADAEKSFNQAILVSKQLNSRADLAEAYHNLGLLYKKKNQKNKTRESLRAAQEIYILIDLSKYRQIKQELLELSSNQ